MKKYYYTIISGLFLISQSLFSQQLPIDFSDSLDDFIPFSGSFFLFNTDPTDSGNDVGQFNNNGAAEYQGFYLDLIQPIDLSYRNTINLSFYSPDSNSHNVIVKLEQGTNVTVEVQKDISSSLQNSWVPLIFDFGLDAGIGSGMYNRLTIFIDGGNLTAGTYLIDNIEYGSTWTDPNAIDVVYSDLVWSDEFDTAGTNNAVDSNKWHHQTLLPFANGGQFNGESQIYTNRLENSFVENDFLNIVAKKENYTDPNQPDYPKEYTSARLNSKFAFTYGRVDVKAKLPLNQGTWPAIWMLGKNINEPGGYWYDTFGAVNWPACGEIDIMEHGIFPDEGINFINSALHTPCCYGGSPNGGGTYATDLENEFHVYSVNWSPNQMTFLLDDVPFYVYKPSVKNASTWPFDEDQYILLNVALGGVAGAIDESVNPGVSMIIDYVRVYQNIGLGTDKVIANQFKAYPNPASNEINIKSGVNIDHIEIYNVFGKLILRQSENTKNVNVSSIKSGIYFLNIYSEGNKTVKKIVIN